MLDAPPVQAEPQTEEVPEPITADEDSEAAQDTDPTVFNLPVWTLPTFVGLSLEPYQALVDTGAQTGVIGKEQYDRIVTFLRKFGLKPRILPTDKGGAHGVGGESTYLLTAEVPTAVQGNCGTLRLNVVQEPIPLLLPISFSKMLGMVLDMPAGKMFGEC